MQEGILRETRYPASEAPSPPPSQAAVSKTAGRGQCTLPFAKVPAPQRSSRGQDHQATPPSASKKAQL